MFNPSDPVERFTAAERYYADGNLRAAADACKDLLDHHPDFAAGYFLMGALFRATGNAEKMVMFTDMAIRLSPDVADFHLQRGHGLLMMSRLDEAKAALERAVALNDGLGVAWLFLGTVALHQSHFSEADRFFERALAIGNVPEVHLQMALSRQAQGDLQGAEREFHLAIAANPKDGNAYLSLARLKLDAGQRDQAEQLFQGAVQADPRQHEAWLGLAKISGSRGESARVIQHATQAIQARPDYLEAYRMLGGVLIEQTMYPQAEEIFRRGLEVSANDLFLIEGLAKVLMQMGRLDEARVMIDRVLVQKPEDENMRYYRDALEGKRVDAAPRDYVARLFDEYADRFDQHLQGALGYDTPRLMADVLRRLLGGSGVLPKELSLLDLGCGTGLAAEAMQDFTARRVGVDLSPRMVEKSRARGLYQETAVADIAEFMERSAEQFDIAVAADVFVYIGDLSRIFAAARTVLKDGGLFAFSVESADDAPPFVLRSTARFGHAASYIESLAAEHGLRVAHRHTSTLRKDREKELEGHVFVLQKPLAH